MGKKSGMCFSRGAQFEMVCERPPRSLRSRLPLVRGRAAEGGRGSLKRHLELECLNILLFRILRVFSIAHCVCFFYRRATFAKGAFRCLVNPSRLHLLFS